MSQQDFPPRTDDVDRVLPHAWLAAGEILVVGLTGFWIYEFFDVGPQPLFIAHALGYGLLSLAGMVGLIRDRSGRR